MLLAAEALEFVLRPKPERRRALLWLGTIVAAILSMGASGVPSMQDVEVRRKSDGEVLGVITGVDLALIEREASETTLDEFLTQWGLVEHA